MKKNLSFSVFLIVTIFSAVLPYAGADDIAVDDSAGGFVEGVSDEMDAALEAQTQPQDGNPVSPSSTSLVAEKPSGSPAPEPMKVKDVLVVEKQQRAADLSSDQTAGEENTENLDSEGNPIPSKGAVLEAAAMSGELMVADFDSGDKPNNLGGDFGGFTKDPNDDTQTCRATFASDDALGNMEGFALRLDYDVDSPSPAYNGFWMKLENLNASPYDTLSFYARGASKRFTKRLKVEIKTPDHRSSAFFVSGINDQWQKIEVPLKRFKGIKDWSILSELVLVFDDVNSAPKKGTLLIDQIALERKEKGMKSVAATSPTVDPLAQSPESDLTTV